MKPIERISFCSVCKNRVRDLHKGYICGVTNRVADFEEECPIFEFDPSSYEYQLDEVAQKIKEQQQLVQSHRYDKEADIDQYYPLKQITIKEEIALPITFKDDPIKKLSTLGCSIILLFLISIFIIIQTIIQQAWDQLLYAFVPIGMVLVLVSIAYIPTKRFTIIQEGIQLKQEFIPWTHVLTFYLKNTTKNSESYLVIKKYVGTSEVNVECLLINSHFLGSILMHCTKKYGKQFKSEP